MNIQQHEWAILFPKAANALGAALSAAFAVPRDEQEHYEALLGRMERRAALEACRTTRRKQQGTI